MLSLCCNRPGCISRRTPSSSRISAVFRQWWTKRYRTGIETCIKALAAVKQGSSFGQEKLFPVFYLNLGKAYVAAGKKKDALEAFNKGLKYDTTNRDLEKEVRALGKRKTAPVPFLDRSNPINKYIGKILQKSGKTADKK